MIETIIYRWSAACILTLAASLLLPRLFRSADQGFSAATSAALIFMGIGLVAAIGATALLAYTVCHFGSINRWPRIAGLVPFFLVVTAAFIVWRLIQQ